MSITGLTILAVYLIALLGVGYWFSKRQESLSDFFVAGRNIPTWAALSAIVATETSAVTFIGAPAKIFDEGNFGFLQLVMGFILARFVLAWFFLPRFFENEIVTIYQFLGTRFGLSVQRVSGIFFFITRAMAAGVRHYAAAIIIEEMTGLGALYAIILTGLISVVYAAMGGLSAVIWTEVIQFGMMLLGAIITFFYLMFAIDGGLGEVIRQGSEVGAFNVFHWDWSGNGFWLGLIGGFMLNLASHGADQDLVQRLLSCRNLTSARWAIITSGFVVFIQFAFLLFIGLMLFVFYNGQLPDGVASNKVLTYFAVNDMTPVAGAFLLAGILSAAMSSTASALNSLSSTSVNDFVRPYMPDVSDERFVTISRIFTFFWMIVLIVIAFLSISNTNIIDLAYTVPSYTYGSLLAAFLLGIFTPVRNEAGLITGMIAGVMAVGVLVFLEAHFTLYVITGSVVTMLVACLLSLVLHDREANRINS